MSLRAVTAAIQQIHPTAFARRSAAGEPFSAALRADSAAALKEQLAATKTLPRSVSVAGVDLVVAERPELLLPSPGAAPVQGPLSGQVLVVSGAASGLGKAVALGLWQAGACVAFTDVDAAGLAAVTAELADPVRVFTTIVDVTKEDSVAAGFDAVLARFGRLDGIACCAGVAPAFNLEDFPLDKWELSLRINLTGYFLYGREAARILKAQGHGGSMVLLSSKSGLEPSKANTAYNATKAGELHMARGWALELGRDGIRVNCISPGNVFEGSKIWNPDYIKKAAEKKGIKPEEVIPYYVGLTALNREIKGQDIANAAVFLASDQARCMTGQVLVVDSGQVWTR